MKVTMTMTGKNRRQLDQSQWARALIEFPFRAGQPYSWPSNRLTSHIARYLGKEKPFRPEMAKGVFYVAGVEGLEPPAPGFGDRCSTN